MGDAGLWPSIEKPGRRVLPSIHPALKGGPRPFWSVMIPTYDRCDYLKVTLKSVLAQDPGANRMQIEVLDNCSPNRDAQMVVKEVGRGRVGFFRQKRNVGMANNWTACVRRAKGQWVHILHDDDAVEPGFYEAFEKMVHKHPLADMAFCRHVVMDERGRRTRTADAAPRVMRRKGLVRNWSRTILAWNFLAAPAVVVKRSAYEKVGGFDPDLKYTADWDMWVRLSFIGRACSLGDKAYLSYRVHSGSDTSRLARSGEDMRDIIRTVEEGLLKFPRSERGRLRGSIYRRYSGFARTNCHVLNARHEFGPALRQAVWAFRLAPGPYNLALAGYDLFRASAQKMFGKEKD